MTRASQMRGYARPHGEGGGVPAVRRVYIYTARLAARAILPTG